MLKNRNILILAAVLVVLGGSRPTSWTASPWEWEPMKKP